MNVRRVKGAKTDLLPQPGANLTYIPLGGPWSPSGAIELARSTAKVDGRLLIAAAVPYGIYDVATVLRSAPSAGRSGPCSAVSGSARGITDGIEDLF